MFGLKFTLEYSPLSSRVLLKRSMRLSLF